MIEPLPHDACRNCARTIADGKADPEGWCTECRAGVVRRATPIAFLAAVGVAILYLLVLGWTGVLSTPNFLVFWLAVGGGLAYGTYKVGRRVAFEVIRAHAMRSKER